MIIYNLKELCELEEKDYSRIYKVQLSNCKLTFIPDIIFELKNLLVLDLSNNLLTSIPNNVCELTQLEVLILSNNNLTSLPENFSSYKKLKQIYLPQNKLSCLSSNIKNVKNIYTFASSFENINNLSDDCEFLQIVNLDVKLDNLPIGLKELRLIEPMVNTSDIKLPLNCDFYINDILQ